jgi:predicted nucleic-acid-binding Zn-ribbon protein
MVHCPDCETTLQNADDVEFIETDAETGILAASKRYYTAVCAECGRTLGSGVAGAKAGGGGGAV